MELVYKNNIIRIFYNFQKERKSLIFLYLVEPIYQKVDQSIRIRIHEQ